jgi:HSP20 family protein
MKEDYSMKITDLSAWAPANKRSFVHRENDNPVLGLQSDINRVFGFSLPAFGRWGLPATREAAPQIDLRETDKDVEIVAELPGMDEKDVDVQVTAGTLVIRGEKKSEQEAKDGDFVVRERSFGKIERLIPLPEGIDPNSASATFKNGVLTIKVAKVAEAQNSAKHIPVRA